MKGALPSTGRVPCMKTDLDGSSPHGRTSVHSTNMRGCKRAKPELLLEGSCFICWRVQAAKPTTKAQQVNPCCPSPGKTAKKVLTKISDLDDPMLIHEQVVHAPGHLQRHLEYLGKAHLALLRACVRVCVHVRT
eukprot:336068-Pelagomonas_calceolata.AAC.1